MSVEEHLRFAGYPSVFDSLTLTDLRNVRCSPNVRQAILRASGAVDVKLIAKVSEEHRADMTTGQIAAVLAACSPTAGLPVNTTGELQFIQRADGGTFQGNGYHVTLNSTKGFLAPDELSASQDDEQGAILSLMYWALSESDNAPLIANVSQNLFGTPGVAAMYKLGPIVFEEAILDSHQRMSVRFGIEYNTKRAAGRTTPTVGSIIERGATASFDADNLEILGVTGFGEFAIDDGITFYFEKVDAAPEDNVHVSVNFASGKYVVSEVAAGGKNDASIRVDVNVINTITVSTTAALPA